MLSKAIAGQSGQGTKGDSNSGDDQQLPTGLELAISFNVADPIFNKCVDLFEVLSTCVQVYFSKACAQVILVGLKVADSCAGWDRNGNQLTAQVKFTTVNVGIWKLERPTFDLALDLNTNSGVARFSGILYKLQGFPPDYSEKQRWDGHVIGQW